MCILEKLTVKTDLDSQFLFIKFNDNKESVLMAKMFASWQLHLSGSYILACLNLQKCHNIPSGD